MPVWVGNYVLMSYGDGAVMGVPAHDERDFAFANKYGIEIIQVVLVDDEPHFDYHRWQDWYADKHARRDHQLRQLQRHALMPRPSRRWRMRCSQKGLGDMQTTWRLRDWGVSRQRYWGTPIPIIHCDEHGAVPVPEKDLPVVLPTDCVPDGSGNPLHQARRLPCRRGLPGLRQARAARDRHDGHLRRQRRGTSCATATRRTTRPWSAEGARLLDADGPVHRRHRARDPAPALRALLDQGDARPRAW